MRLKKVAENVLNWDFIEVVAFNYNGKGTALVRVWDEPKGVPHGDAADDSLFPGYLFSLFGEDLDLALGLGEDTVYQPMVSRDPTSSVLSNVAKVKTPKAKRNSR